MIGTIYTRKFSQFVAGGPEQTGDMPVGLRSGVNTIWEFQGSSNSGSGVIIVIDQPNHNLNPGDWVRINSDGIFVQAQADTPEDAEISGCVVLNPTFNANQFTLQVLGYVGPGVFTGLTPGGVYFLSNNMLGQMTLTEPSAPNDISLPLFIAYTSESGFIRQSRGVILNGNEFIPGSSGPSSGYPSIITITQVGHGLNLGDVVRLAGSVNYVRALADNLADAQAVGVVINPNPNGDGNSFILQTEGYCTNVILTDDMSANMVAAGVYYLTANASHPGRTTLNPPSGPGQATKPIFICEQGASGTSAGYIMPQRPLANATTPPDSSIHTFISSSIFAVGQWVFIQSDSTYALAQANNYSSSQVAGVITSKTGSSPYTYTVQQSGWIANIIDGTYVDSPPSYSSGNVLWLSPTTAGNLTPIMPTGSSQYTKPCYVQEVASGYVGEILPQRPLAVGTADLTTTQITSASNFNVGQWIYINGDGTIALAIATSLDTSQVAGLITAKTGTGPYTYTIQQSGWVAGAVTGAFVDAGLSSGNIMYLSATTAGNISNVVPVTVGQVTKPCYVQELQSTRFGEILPQRPLVITAPSGGGGMVLIETVNLASNPNGAYLSNIFNGTYTDITIIGRNIVALYPAMGQYFGGFPYLQFEIGGILVTGIGMFTTEALALSSPLLQIIPGPYYYCCSFADFYTPSGASLSFDIDIYGINKTGVTKGVTLFSTSFYANNPYSVKQQRSSGQIGINVNTNLNPLSGFALYPTTPSGVVYTFVSGTLSVYGTVS